MYKEIVEGVGGIVARIVEDSIHSKGNGDYRLTTMQLTYPRLIHAEFMTHRVFSRNASSSRAIPVAKVIEQVRTNPAMPIHWGTNQPGMQAGAELSDSGIIDAKDLWLKSAIQACDVAENMMDMGLHKQVANRILEPFQFMQVVVTATEWENFFNLRLHPAADPNIHELARVMKEVYEKSVAALMVSDNDLHLPYVTLEERVTLPLDDLIKASVARCARVSYLNHDKSEPDFEKDVALHDMLFEAKHMSPFEHVASPDLSAGPESHWYGNFRNWIQYRTLIGA